MLSQIDFNLPSLVNWKGKFSGYTQRTTTNYTRILLSRIDIVWEATVLMIKLSAITNLQAPIWKIK